MKRFWLFFIFLVPLLASAETRSNSGFGATYNYTITRGTPAGTVSVQYLSGSAPSFGGHWFKVYDSSGNITYSGDPGTSKVTSPVGGTIWVAIWQSVNTNVGSTFTVFSDVEKTTQTIAVSPTTATINKGDVFTFTVSGHQTSLVFSTDGISVTPPNWSKTFDQIGIHTFTVKAESDSTYAESNIVTVSVTVKGYRVKIKLPANKSSYTIIYEVIQGGADITSLVQVPGAAERTQVIEVPSSSPVTIKPRMVGVNKDGSLFVEDEDGEVTLTPIIMTPVQVVSDTDTVAEQLVPTNGAPTKPNVSDEEKSVWNRTTGDDEAAKNKTLKEGTDKIVSALDVINNTLKGSLKVVVQNGGVGGGTTVDFTGVETRLDTANDTLSEMNERERARDEANEVTTPTTLENAKSLATGAEQYTGEKLTGSPAASTGIVSAPSAALGTWAIVPGHNVTLSLLPDSIWSGASDLLTACRPLLLWAGVMACIWSCGRVLDTYLQAMPQVVAADAAAGIENALPGVAQAKTWGAAALLVGAVVAAAAVMIAALHTFVAAKGFGITDIFNAVNLSAVGAGLGVVDRYVPILALVSLWLFRVGFSFVVAPIYIAATSAMRFLKA
jgi:hypothetical protein